MKVVRLHLGASQPHQKQKPVRHWASKSCQDERLAPSRAGQPRDGSEARIVPKPRPPELVFAATAAPFLVADAPPLCAPPIHPMQRCCSTIIFRGDVRPLLEHQPDHCRVRLMPPVVALSLHRHPSRLRSPCSPEAAVLSFDLLGTTFFI
jgi:hypothetical protein